MTPRRWRRVPLRRKLTAVYVIVAVVALAGIGGLLFLSFESELNRSIDADLRSRSQALAALVAQQGPDVIHSVTATRLLRPQGAFAQIVDRRTGKVVQTTLSLTALRVLTAAQALRFGTRSTLFTRTEISGVAKRARFSAERLPASVLVVLVGRSLKDREGANESFARALFIGGPLALLLAALAAYGLTAAALRPVERMRRRAATISAGDPHARLPVPEGDDEISRLGETLNDMLGRLDAAFAQQRALTANASHELRTPLAVLTSSLEIALRRDRSADELRAVLHQALTETRHLSALAEDLLLLARLDESGPPSQRETFALDGLVGEVIARLAWSTVPGDRGVTMVPSGLSVHADRLQFERAISNLLDNAITHGRGAVTVGAIRAASRVQIHVTDEGAGVPPEFVQQAFDRFARHPSARSRPGSGLGLSIVAAVAAAHGGTAHVSPRPPSDVWIDVPAGI